MRIKRLFSAICMITVLLSAIFNYKLNVSAQTNATNLIYSFVHCVNEEDVDSYIDLFPQGERDEMREFIERMGRESFFAESSREIIDIEVRKDFEPEDILNQYEDVIAYRVTENIKYKDAFPRTTCNLTNGTTISDYVLVKENGDWYIYRVSIVNSEGNRSLSRPIETFIYFTKSVNISYYGAGTSGIYWDFYLEDVLPKEWYISYYNSYPAYAYSSALASKMYAWYNTVNPKWGFAPYYASMKDNSDDQNYEVWSKSNMLPIYQNYENAVLSYISNRAIVNSATGGIFEIHYHATSGSYHSGTMSASGCLSFAQSGSTYESIIHYYYDGSTYIGSSNTANVVTY